MKLPLSYSVLLLTLLCYFSITIVNACDESSVKIKPLLKNRSPTLQQQQGLSPEETQYITLPEANKSREYLQFYTSFTHVAGTPGDLEAAAYTLGKFKSFGLNAELMPETVLLSLPLEAAIASVSSPQSGKREIERERVCVCVWRKSNKRFKKKKKKQTLKKIYTFFFFINQKIINNSPTQVPTTLLSVKTLFWMIEQLILY